MIDYKDYYFVRDIYGRNGEVYKDCLLLIG